jgi:DNA-binding NtrC family response regulator
MEALKMARVQLLVDEVPQRMTLQAALEAAGHSLVETSPDVLLTDSYEAASRHAASRPTLVLATASMVPAAVRLMREAGVFGYVYVPLQPGEAAIAAERAAARGAGPNATAGDHLRTLEDVEMEHIERVLRHCKHNQAKAARILGIGRNTLWRKLKRVQKSGAK